MSLRLWAAFAALVFAGWWYSPVSPRVPAPPAALPGHAPTCPPPPLAATDGPPLQSPVPSALGPFRLEAASLQPLAGFSIDARVLSREDYVFGREAELSPTDLALGWQRMREDAVLSQLDISQSSRWYQYRWQGDAPLPPDEIARSSANMHLIPSDGRVAQQLRDVRRGDRVRVDGWLVEASTADGWRWRSSLTRDDSGAGACELIYVCAIPRHRAVVAKGPIRHPSMYRHFASSFARTGIHSREVPSRTVPPRSLAWDAESRMHDEPAIARRSRPPAATGRTGPFPPTHPVRQHR